MHDSQDDSTEVPAQRPVAWRFQLSHQSRKLYALVFLVACICDPSGQIHMDSDLDHSKPVRTHSSFKRRARTWLQVTLTCWSAVALYLRDLDALSKKHGQRSDTHLDGESNWDANILIILLSSTILLSNQLSFQWVGNLSLWRQLIWVSQSSTSSSATAYQMEISE